MTAYIAPRAACSDRCLDANFSLSGLAATAAEMKAVLSGHNSSTRSCHKTATAAAAATR
eukprot:CAMPEP_0172709616 /NCGR_PEP_ID=MMETSP1074-20121228/55172_1 /TAXON_ID=2916 /ORGANISM="Ceratium fusus, Strain PA161109" /LENGTH=58 /DNA_ID=CAMNT_0013532899 /DNA_START=290 /DNA_END=466 /DNA_ORIENTATION=-